jgi:hypothetical protein
MRPSASRKARFLAMISHYTEWARVIAVEMRVRLGLKATLCLV